LTDADGNRRSAAAAPRAGGADAPYADLSPDAALDALDAVGFRGDGRLLQLNSYENRVFQVYLEAGGSVVAKFYRPARWSDAQILEEHAFARELAAAEIPVAAPERLARDADSPHAGGADVLGATLARVRTAAGTEHRVAVAPRLAGRGPELDDPEVRRRIGRVVGRMHAVGRTGAFAERQRLDVAAFGRSSRDWLVEHAVLPPDAEGRWLGLADRALDACDRAFAEAAATPIRLHGDCHLGNVLWSEGGPSFVDFDDCVSGPAVQDLWMLLSGDRAAMQRQLGDVLDGYEAFVELDRAELALVEPLRTLRMLHHSAWIARRWHDPAFPIAFPWFESPAYWQEQCTRLGEQLEAMAEPPLVA
jgi:Ser/Thr protein kinase RdoA (MazF antagonist)